VGVGQAEVEIASLADTTVVLLAPGMGDGIQAAKAGILEVADVYVVNKADRDGADHTIRDLRTMMSLAEKPSPDAWKPPIIKTIALRGEGNTELVEALAKHLAWLTKSGNLQVRRTARIADEIEAIALTSVRQQIGDLRGGTLLTDLAARVAAGETDPYAAADQLMAAVASS
jgi:LAO/AO transport system kinase